MSINIYKKPTGYNFDGEPLIIVGADGTTFEFRGGQPVMDAGLENWVTIALFTKPGWWGNYILETENQVGDSDFDDLIKSSITQEMLIESEKEARRALKTLVSSGVSSGIDVEIEPQSGFGINLIVKVNKPDGTSETLIYQKYGINWLRQASDPANARITDDGN